jgi:hypothetical protein
LYELEADRQVASDLFPGTRKRVISNLPYVAFIRQLDGEVWEAIDIVHTSRRLPNDQ